MRLSRLIALLPLLAACAAHSQQYPSKPIRLIIPMAAGGATDILIRTMTPKLSEVLGQQIVVDNRPGANGVIGDEMGVRAAPDGHTLLANSLAIAINPSLYKLNYDITRDLVGVTQMASIDLLLGVNPQVPAKTVAELVALAKAQPGKLNYASFGIGSIVHLAAEMFKLQTGTQIVHVAYKGTPQAVQETIAGQTQFMFGGIPYMLPHAKTGRLRGIAVSSMQRSPLAPEIPTINESGVPGFDVTAWFGMWLPVKTPPEIVKRVNDAMVKVMTDLKPTIEGQGYRPGGNSSEEFTRFYRAEVAKFARVIKDANIRPDN